MKIENGTFYHCGDTLNARITYKLTAKMYDSHFRKESIDEDSTLRMYRTETFVKLCNQLKTFILQKQLYDE